MRALTLRLFFATSALLFATSCSAVSPSTGAGGAGGGSASSAASMAQMLQISPADASLDLPEGMPASMSFKATLIGDGNSQEDVTSEAVFTVDDPSFGAFQGGVFTAAGPTGAVTVHATARGWKAETTLHVRVAKVILTPGVPADAPTKFGGPVDANRSPSFAYPADGVLVPPNMNVLEFQFLPGTGNTLFELAFAAPKLVVKVYLTCSPIGSGCGYTPDANVWKLVADAGKGQDPVPYTLRGVNGNTPGAVGVSAAQNIAFGLEDINGGLYYWNAAAGATMRYEFGVTGQTAELYMNAVTAGAATCVGCHVLSRDGKRIAQGLDIPAPSPYKVFDVATKTQVFAQGGGFGGTGANFFSFSPDNAKIMTSNGISIDLRDAANGNPITTDLVPLGTMPDWSPDGKLLVYAHPAVKPPCFPPFCGAPGIDQASLEMLPYDGQAWGAPIPLVPYAGQNNYYPSFSPDGGWVMFNRSPSNANSYDAMDAQVWVVSTSGGAPIKLASASTGGDSWPKWTPNVQIYKNNALLWLTFSSRRGYGLRLAQGAVAQIWMTAFDPVKAKAGKDPSTPAFWLPFQDMNSGNHIAQWVTKVEREPCQMNSDCESGELCMNGLCLPVVK